MKQEILVSICCITYNHENYIRDAIESFLMQETKFPIEIIIHDDASTDGTQHIIKEFADKDDCIIPIFRKENIKSTGVAVFPITFEKARGKYIALCEGDDYWTDPLKLQKQITELEKRPDCDMSFHPAIAKYDNGIKKDEIIGYHSENDKMFSPNEMILGGPSFCPTVSLVIRKNAIEKGSLYEEYDFRFSFFTQIFGSLRGGALYIAEPMAVYRKMSRGSWNERSKKDSEILLDHNKSILNYLNKAKLVTENKYHKEFNILISKRIMRVLKNKDIELYKRKNLYKNNKNSMNVKHRLKWIIICIKNYIK